MDTDASGTVFNSLDAVLSTDKERGVVLVVPGGPERCRQLLLKHEGGARVVSALVLLDAFREVTGAGGTGARLVRVHMAASDEHGLGQVCGANVMVIGGAACACRVVAGLEGRADVLDAMASVGLSAEEQRAVFALVAGVLQAQTLRFVDHHERARRAAAAMLSLCRRSDLPHSMRQSKDVWPLIARCVYGTRDMAEWGAANVVVENPATLSAVAALWHADAARLENSLLNLGLLVRSELYNMPRDRAQACFARDQMCRAVFVRTLGWLQCRVNALLAPPPDATLGRCLHLLVVPELCDRQNKNVNINNIRNNDGDVNGFDELLANYGSEVVEGLRRVQPDNAQLPSRVLFDKGPFSVLGLLDEESMFPKATDMTLLQKLNTALRKQACFQSAGAVHAADGGGRAVGQFSVQHHNGHVVEYSVNDWIARNRNRLDHLLTLALVQTPDTIVASLFATDEFYVLAEASADGGADTRGHTPNHRRKTNATDPMRPRPPLSVVQIVKRQWQHVEKVARDCRIVFLDSEAKRDATSASLV